MEENLIRDEGDPRKYYTQIPNLVDDTEMSVYAFRLYVHLKRVAGDAGKCWQGTETLAKACNMSAGKISDAKQELKILGLIKIEKVKDTTGWHDEIVIVDVWRENMLKYGGFSSGEKGFSCDEKGFSSHETKNNPVKKNPHEGDELAPCSVGERKLFTRLDYEARAKGRAGPKRYETVAQRDKFLEAEKRLTPEQLDAAIDAAMVAGATARSRAVNYIAAWGKNRPAYSNQNNRLKANNTANHPLPDGV